LDDKALTLLTAKIEGRRQQLMESLADGGPKDFAEFRYMCGTIRGLTFAQQEIEDLVRNKRDIDNE
jgi:hypothetical protein